MACKHANIRVYEEITYHAAMVDGVVMFDTNAPSIESRTAECMDCDESFDNIQPEEDDDVDTETNR